jgi:YHS domain-containing protein
MCKLKIDERKIDFSVLHFMGKSYRKGYFCSAATEDNFGRIDNIVFLSVKENKQSEQMSQSLLSNCEYF